MSDPFTGLKICYWNANGIYSKLTDFKNFVHNHNPDVIHLQETMFKPAQTIFIPNYNFFHVTVHKTLSQVALQYTSKTISLITKFPCPPLKSIKTTIISGHFANIADITSIFPQIIISSSQF
ncbi:hypothetical protein CEXT_370891 [Caerostris extrusa]|uniref:Uncharacterized protein n=1 Tax=Caerostris extrusa TaxID=172846 RepID=A0AAV4TSW4_CAEEX|nr:hypothetical protein CEXT_370891 [Caerostris extrusa]